MNSQEVSPSSFGIINRIKKEIRHIKIGKHLTQFKRELFSLVKFGVYEQRDAMLERLNSKESKLLRNQSLSCQ